MKNAINTSCNSIRCTKVQFRCAKFCRSYSKPHIYRVFDLFELRFTYERQKHNQYAIPPAYKSGLVISKSLKIHSLQTFYHTLQNVATAQEVQIYN